jgi:excisionase family DNA binding protein
VTVPLRDDGSFPEDEILTSVEACRFLKIGRTKLWELTRTHSLPAYRVGEGKTSGLRYKKSELIRWLEGNRVGRGLRQAPGPHEFHP